jgi:hypothetical protein
MNNQLFSMGDQINEVMAIHNVIDKINNSYPWWCITPRMKAWWFIRQLRKEREVIKDEVQDRRM